MEIKSQYRYLGRKFLQTALACGAILVGGHLLNKDSKKNDLPLNEEAIINPQYKCIEPFISEGINFNVSDNSNNRSVVYRDFDFDGNLDEVEIYDHRVRLSKVIVNSSKLNSWQDGFVKIKKKFGKPEKLDYNSRYFDRWQTLFGKSGLADNNNNGLISMDEYKQALKFGGDTNLDLIDINYRPSLSVLERAVIHFRSEYLTKEQVKNIYGAGR